MIRHIGSELLIPWKKEETPREGTRPTMAQIPVGRVPLPGDLVSWKFLSSPTTKREIRKSKAEKGLLKKGRIPTFHTAFFVEIRPPEFPLGESYVNIGAAPVPESRPLRNLWCVYSRKSDL